MDESEEKKKERHASLANRPKNVPHKLKDFKKNLFSMKKGKYG